MCLKIELFVLHLDQSPCEAVLCAPKMHKGSFCLQIHRSVTSLEAKLLSKLLDLICLFSLMLMRAVEIGTPGTRPSCSGENIREGFQAMETLHVSTPSCVQNTNKEHFPLRLAVEGVKQSGTHPFAHFLVFVLKWQRKKNLWNLAHRRVINRFVEIKFCCKCSGLGSIQEGRTTDMKRKGKC